MRASAHAAHAAPARRGTLPAQGVAWSLRGLLRLAGNLVPLLAVLVMLGLAVGPRTGAYRTLTMLSGSMNPRYPTGAVLVDTPEPLSRLRVGQVLTYAIPVLDHHVESHRVTSLVPHPDGSVDIQTKGDANVSPDPWRAHVVPGTVWVVRGAVPGAGWAIVQLRRPLVRSLLQYLLPAVLLGSVLVAIWKPSRRPNGPRGHARR